MIMLTALIISYNFKEGSKYKNKEKLVRGEKPTTGLSF
jgi:hypothetical protein